MVDLVRNPRGAEFLDRDVRNISGWFASRGLPPEIGDLYLRCVDLAPDRRPTAREAAAILAAAVGVRPVTAGADDDDDPPNRPTVLTSTPVGDPVHPDDMAPMVGAGTSRERRVAMVVAVVGVVAGILVVSNANSSARRPPPRADGVPTIQAPGPAQTPPGPGTPPGQPNSSCSSTRRRSLRRSCRRRCN